MLILEAAIHRRQFHGEFVSGAITELPVNLPSKRAGGAAIYVWPVIEAKRGTILTATEVEDRCLNGVQITYGQLPDGLQQTVSVEGDLGTDDSDGGRIAETRKCDPGIAVGLPSFFHAGKMAGRDGALID